MKQKEGGAEISLSQHNHEIKEWVVSSYEASH